MNIMKTLRRILLAAMMLLCVSAVADAKKIRKITATDVILFYAGGSLGNFFDQDYAADYVSYVDRDGQEHWLFDGFLLLQIWDTNTPTADEIAYTPDMKDRQGNWLLSANQADWKKLIDYYFEEGSCIDAIDKAVGEAAERLGKPSHKRQIFISIYDPMKYRISGAKKGGTTYWGLVDNKVMDFSEEEDRATACKWFVDECIREFKSHSYKNVELGGFYWIMEEVLDDSPLRQTMSDYVHSKGYPYTWIPYFHAPGYEKWRELGFDQAWYQPNYFFYNVPESQITVACHEGPALGMGMEMELDERASVKPLWGDVSLAYKLRAYMRIFKETGVWATCPFAYYQDTHAVRHLKRSDDPADVELFQDFSDFVAKRPYREGK